MKLYVDLDQTLTDFDQQASELFEVPVDKVQDYLDANPTKGWAKITDAGAEFWSQMPWMSDGKILWDYLKDEDPTILSSPTKHPSSIEGKKKWLGVELPGVHYILDHDKASHAEEGDILIDDREDNIKKWRKAGGVGILHKNAKDTIRLLKALEKFKEKTAMMTKSVVSPNDPSKNIVIVKDRGGRKSQIQKSLKGKGSYKRDNKIPLSDRLRDLAATVVEAKELTYKEKENLPGGSFVFPASHPKVTDDKDHFPINDEAHGRNALARANQYGSAPAWFKGSLEELKKTIADKVKAKYPQVEVSEESYK